MFHFFSINKEFNLIKWVSLTSFVLVLFILVENTWAILLFLTSDAISGGLRGAKVGVVLWPPMLNKGHFCRTEKRPTRVPKAGMFLAMSHAQLPIYLSYKRDGVEGFGELQSCFYFSFLYIIHIMLHN